MEGRDTNKVLDRVLGESVAGTGVCEDKDVGRGYQAWDCLCPCGARGPLDSAAYRHGAASPTAARFAHLVLPRIPCKLPDVATVPGSLGTRGGTWLAPIPPPHILSTPHGPLRTGYLHHTISTTTADHTQKQCAKAKPQR
ncbi:uncharacterized protein BKA78DRAFT_829 [Phyllosticta capitalensis]|uniref:uncharacterized protein n=1 Tax=Phyllosticta capitalensis TaxID=121624 RepID=UPI00312FF4E0